MAILSEEQTMLRDMAREWTTNESPIKAFRAMRDSVDAKGYDAGAFKNKDEAGPLSELMRGAGIHTTVVFRTGRVY